MICCRWSKNALGISGNQGNVQLSARDSDLAVLLELSFQVSLHMGNMAVMCLGLDR